MQPTRKKTILREAACLALLLLALGASVWNWRVCVAARPGAALRVAAPESQWLDASLSPYGRGFEQELLERFCAEQGRELRWVRTESWEEAWEALAKGRADLVLGLGAEPPATLLTPIAAGPSYAHFRPLLAQDSRARGRSGETAALLPESPALLAGLDRRVDSLAFQPLPGDQGGAAPPPVRDSRGGDTRDQDLADAGRFRLWPPFHPGLRAAGTRPDKPLYRWYWSDADQTLADGLAAFWKNTAGSRFLKDLQERYFGFLPEGADACDLADLADAARTRLPRFAASIAAASRRYGVDPLLLTAVIYQESRFDPEARSATGARGLMQLTRATAEELGVGDRTDPAQSIDAGARYLRSLHDQIEEPGIHAWDRWFLALAAYNLGLSHVRDAMDLARGKGGGAASWREVKRVFPLLRLEKYAREASAGYARGAGQAVDFVESVRYWCYVLHGIVVLARPEAEELAALVAGLAVAARP